MIITTNALKVKYFPHLFQEKEARPSPVVATICYWYEELCKCKSRNIAVKISDIAISNLGCDTRLPRELHSTLVHSPDYIMQFVCVKFMSRLCHI